MAETWAIVLIVAVLVIGIACVVAYLGAVSGRLVVDTGWGRRVQALGPLALEISADRDDVYALLTQPYVGRATHALADKVEVLERGSDLVLAAHRTPIRSWLTAVTVETVRFAPGQRIDFRLVRGPVPYVVESFILTDSPVGCELHYQGELGTDFGALGAWWGRMVARYWLATVGVSMRTIKSEAEHRAGPRS